MKAFKVIRPNIDYQVTILDNIKSIKVVNRKQLAKLLNTQYNTLITN